MTTKVEFSISNAEGTIYFDGTVNCTFKQLADALESAMLSRSFTTLQISPAGPRMEVKRSICVQREGGGNG